MAEKSSNFDVVIVGAGISGIDAAYRLQTQTPDQTFTIIEARDAIGGTWDLFKFPGIRSDSDLYTFGFPFKPWVKPNAIAEASAILEYLDETVREFGIDRKIQFHHKLQSANWSSDSQSWSLEVDASGQQERYNCNFVLFCTGYYDYENPLSATIPGLENFSGTTIHPQFWPEKLDYTNKHVVVIGSGATAITIVPNVAKTAARTTMLQRSPSFVVAQAQDDAINRFFRSYFPYRYAHSLIRFKSFILPELFYRYCRRFPTAARRLIKKGAASLLPPDYPLDPNFEPKYNPWEQRMCICPGGDFFEALKNGSAEIVTAAIETVTHDTIVLKDTPTELKPDIIVTATGLRLLIAGGATISVDNEPVHIPDRTMYRGMMLSDVPNAAIVIGYTNASWTLGADTTAQFVTRLLNHMKTRGYTQAVPHFDESQPMGERPVLDLSATYISKGGSNLPKAGDRGPWRPRKMWLTDLWDAWYGSFTDLEFSRVSS